jgi:putative membrane protein
MGTALAAYYGHMMDGWDGGAWAWFGGTLMMLAFVALIGVVIWAIVRGQPRDISGRTTANGDATASARTILAERFARGEISQEEYRQKLETLRT